MKRNILFILCIFGFAATAWAQDGWGRGGNRPQLPPAEAVTITGSLTIAYGMPAIISGGDTYLLRRASRLAGFVDGFRAGAYVTVEGYAVTSPHHGNLKFLNPAQLTLDGVSYDLTSPAAAFGLGRQFCAPFPHSRPRAGYPQRHHRQGFDQRGSRR
ncbi:MAG: hypothetical protein FWC65_03005 [Treponema sp.]|nr:hypothetical protein [Treponema sp.]